MRAKASRRLVTDDESLEPLLDALDIHHAATHGWQKFKCLFHDEDVASMTFNVEAGCWNCFACGAKGSGLIPFLMQYEHLDREAATARLAELLPGRTAAPPATVPRRTARGKGFKPRYVNKMLGGASD